jgi:hypothetical protein
VTEDVLKTIRHRRVVHFAPGPKPVGAGENPLREVPEELASTELAGNARNLPAGCLFEHPGDTGQSRNLVRRQSQRSLSGNMLIGQPAGKDRFLPSIELPPARLLGRGIPAGVVTLVADRSRAICPDRSTAPLPGRTLGCGSDPPGFLDRIFCRLETGFRTEHRITRGAEGMRFISQLTLHRATLGWNFAGSSRMRAARLFPCCPKL